MTQTALTLPIETSNKLQQTELLTAFLVRTLQSVPLPNELELRDKLTVWNLVLHLQASSPATTTYGFV